MRDVAILNPNRIKEVFSNMWRWDQGRLTYFSLNKIKKIASAIVELDGVNLRDEQDPLRELMPQLVGLPFKPVSYRVWRNYARVFKVLGLASSLGNRMVATQLCHKLVSTENEGMTYDEYIQYITKTFYYPSPIFEGYSSFSDQSFPFCAIVKFLIAKAQSTGKPSISVEEVFEFLIGNNVNGCEPLGLYSQLRSTTLSGDGDQVRQVREMLIFLSQLSYLSWIGGELFIDMGALSNLSNDELIKLVTPIIRPRESGNENEIQNINSLTGDWDVSLDLKEPVSVEDLTFTEGKKVRVTHLRTERNRKVVKHYFENSINPCLCDVCDTEVVGRYPWMTNLIEVHHILPLSSPLHVDKQGTSMSDLVGLCPNCHRATHAYYRAYLSERNINDFESEEHAKEVYSLVKTDFVVI